MDPMRWMRAALLVWAAATACRFSFNGIDSNSDMATRPGDLGGGNGDMPSSCTCFAGCPSACALSPTKCQSLQPTGPVTAGDYGMTGLGPITVGSNVLVNPDTGMITSMPPGGLARPGVTGVVGGIGFHVVTQNGGPNVGVFSVASLKVATNVKITVVGGNAFALASAGAVEIDGTIDASCNGPAMFGPGGSAGGTSSMPTAAAPAAGKAGFGGGGGKAAGGGGGAAYGDAGGSGALVTGATANGGAPWGDLTTPTFLLIGGSGGGGGAGANLGGKGGGGGGAVQLAVNDTLTISGVIDVGGCGGGMAGMNDGGGGGGSGGAIVLEATRVVLASSAVLAANGGGGGGGDNMSMPGADASASVVPAPGGAAVTGAGGDGGNGGASNGMPGQRFTNGRDGLIADPANDFGGGGGGGVGRIAIRAANPTAGGISDSSSAVTPDAADVNTVGAHPTNYGAANFQ